MPLIVHSTVAVVLPVSDPLTSAPEREAGIFYLLDEEVGGKESSRTISEQGKDREEAKTRTELCPLHSPAA